MAPNDDDERNDLLTVLLPADGKKAHKGEEGRESFPRMEKGVRQTQYVFKSSLTQNLSRMKREEEVHCEASREGDNSWHTHLVSGVGEALLAVWKQDRYTEISI